MDKGREGKERRERVLNEIVEREGEERKEQKVKDGIQVRKGEKDK